MRTLMAVLVIGLAVFAAGCKYYMVEDPSTGQTYYTQKVENMKSGAVKFEDGKTGATVTVQNSKVTEITEQSYKAGLAGSSSSSEGESK